MRYDGYRGISNGRVYLRQHGKIDDHTASVGRRVAVSADGQVKIK